MTYKVDHDSWCQSERHQSCCGEDQCDCGAAETQRVIDRLEARLNDVRCIVSGYGMVAASADLATQFMADLDRALNGDLA